MMRTRTILLLLTVVMLFSGCAAVPLSVSYHHQPGGAICPKPKLDLLVVVKPTENRPGGGRSSVGLAFLTFIPLVPYGAQKLTPEFCLPAYQFRKDLGETVAKDLRAAGIATSTIYVGDASQAPLGRGASSLLLDLKLKEGFWYRKYTLYGMSLAGVPLWFVGAPVSYGKVRIELEAALKDPKGKQLAQQTFMGEASLTDWIYGGMYSCLRGLPPAYGQISPKLRSFVLENIPR